jgi:hypothetical protein
MHEMTRYWQSTLEELEPKKLAENAIRKMFVDRIEGEGCLTKSQFQNN